MKRKLYNFGGFVNDNLSWQNQNTGYALGAGSTLASQGMDLIPDNKVVDNMGNFVGSYDKTGTALGKGALQGAAAGAAFGPIGMGVGALTGAAIGYVNNNKQKDMVNKQRTMFNNQNFVNSNINRGGANTGIASGNMNNYFKFGGKFNRGNAEIEDGEFVEVPDGTTASSVAGGNLSRTSDGGFVASGQTHNEGGIDVNLPNGARIYSDKLKYNGKTFANHARKIDKSIGTMEKQLELNPSNKSISGAIERMQKRKDQLFELQQTMNDGYGEGDAPVFDNGGTFRDQQRAHLRQRIARKELPTGDLTSTESHNNGAYGSFGFRKSGHLGTFYNNPKFGGYLRSRYPDYDSLWNAYTTGKMPKGEVNLLHDKYADWLLDSADDNADAAMVLNLDGYAGLKNYKNLTGKEREAYLAGKPVSGRQGQTNMRIGDYLGYTNPIPGTKIPYGIQTGYGVAPNGKRVLPSTQSQEAFLQNLNAMADANPVTADRIPVSETVYDDSTGMNRYVPMVNEIPRAGMQTTSGNVMGAPRKMQDIGVTPIIQQQPVQELYQPSKLGMYAGATANMLSNFAQTNRINNTPPPRPVTARSFYAGPAPEKINYSAEINAINADANADRTLLRRGTAGNTLGANLANLRAQQMRQRSSVFNQANNANAGLANEYSRRLADTTNMGIKMGYDAEVMNNENLMNYNLWRTGAKNAANAGMAGLMTNLGNLYTQSENQVAALDAMNRGNVSGTGERKMGTQTTVNKRRNRTIFGGKR